MRTKNLAILASVLLAIGCDNGNGGTDGGGMTDAGTMPGNDACATCGTDSGHMTNPDSGPTDDGNNDFAMATAIEVDATDATTGSIDPAGDLDYYTFEGTAGQWIVINTDANPDDDPEMVDTVITLYDSSMTQIAENDDSLPRFNTDSELITRLPADGTYYILVQEWSTWDGTGDAEGMPSFTYDLTAFAVDPTVAGFNAPTESGNDVASAQALTVTAQGGSFIFGTVEDAADVDVYSFTIDGADPMNFAAELMPSGTTGDGAAASPTRLWITNADGTETIASLDPSTFDPLESGEYVDLNPSLPPGDYLLFVEGGSADFYVIKGPRAADSAPEDDDAMNADPATPDRLVLMDDEAVPAGTVKRDAYVVAHLGADDDVDHFLIEGAFEGETITVACGSRSNGSGVQDLTVTLLDATGDNEIAHATETATDAAYIDAAEVPADGSYLVRLTKSGQDTEITGDWVHCGIHLLRSMTP